MRVRPTVRFLLPHEGAVIRELYASAQSCLTHQIDWTRPLAMNWLVAETDQVLGCLMVNYGSPIGRLDFMVMRPGVPRALLAVAVRDLIVTGIETLRQHGSQLVAGVASDNFPGYARFLVKRGGVVTDHGAIIIKRID